MSEQESEILGRPMPHLPETTTTTTENKLLDQDSDSSNGGRRHAPASVSKTSFTANTPASHKRAIQKLKQSLTFSDQSSSASSTPHKTTGSLHSAQSGQGSTHSLQGSAHSAPPAIGAALPAVDTGYAPSPALQGDEGEGSEYISEGEAPSGLSVHAILSKLDQVKNYLQEAESLHMQMKQRLSEPGMMAQVNKMGKLVEDLRKQESGYFSILLKLLDQQDQGHPSQVAETRGLESEDFSEDGGSEGEMPSGEEEEGVGEDEGEEDGEGEEGEGANDSMSLKAELLKDRMAAQQVEHEKQEEELRMLREQRALLKKLLEQQKQIEDLESRQRSLLAQKSDAEALLDSSAAQGSLTATSQHKPSGPNEQTLISKEDEIASAVTTKLRQLRERQARVEELTCLLNQLKAQSEKERESHLPKESSGAEVTRCGTSEAVTGSNELVAVGDQALPAGLLELQQKLKKAEEARAKLNELQEMLSLLESVGSDHVLSHVKGPPQLPPASRQGVGDVEREAAQGHNDTESEGELDQSMLSEYEERLELKRQEVSRLQQQRDKLLATQRKLQELQQNASPSIRPTPPTEPSREVTTDSTQPVLSSQLASELGRQRRLYDDLLNKTEQIQSMVDEVAGARDVTAATWGGSSAPTSEDGEDSTASLPGPGGLDDTREDLDHTYTATLGDSATAVAVTGEQDGPPGVEGVKDGEEGLVFRVTRHTPRQLRGGMRGGQRRMLTPEESPQSTGKRMKLDMTSSSDKGTKSSPPGGARPPIGSYSAVWPGVIFPPPSRKQTREEATQTGEVATASGMPGPSLVDDHITLLHHQLGVASSMATQLAYSQQALISTMCRQLESLQLEDRIQDHFARLHQYQAELEQYYQELQSVYLKPLTVDEVDPEHPDLQQQQEQQEGEEREDVEVDGEEPIFRPRLSPQPLFSSTTASAVPGPTTTTGFGMPAPLPRDHRTTLTEASVGGGQQNEAFRRQSAGSFQQVPAMPVYPGAQGSNVPSRRPSQGVPPVPMGCASHTYQHQPHVPIKEEDGAPDVPLNVDPQMMGSFAPAPPPPLAPYIHPSPYTPYHSWMPPTPLPTLSHPTLGHPLQPSPGLIPVPRIPFHSPYTRYRLSWPPAHFPVSPQYPVYPSSYYGPPVPSAYDPDTGCSLNSSRNYSFNYPHSGFSGKAGSAGQRPYSPSGVTGVSMQVQPPTSPPSAPSISNLNHSSLQPSTESGLLQHSSSSTLQAPTTATSHTNPTKLSNLSPHLVPPYTTHPNTNSATAQEAAKWQEKQGEGEGGARLTAGSQTRAQDADSLSSLPLSLPDASRDGGGAVNVEKPPEDFSVFEALRDTIYSEVATLIANNENRPHFLVELFRELQMLSSDYLRQRALYSLQDLVTRYLTEESLQQRQREARAEHDTAGLQAWVGSEPTPSESLVTSDDEAMRTKPTSSTQHPTAVLSASPHSTPPHSQSDETPFAADNLGDTVIRLDKAMARLRESYMSRGSPGAMRPPVISPGPLASADLSQSSQSESTQYTGDLNTEKLDEQIKAVMTEVIPLLKEHMTTLCSSQLLQQIKQLVMSLVLAQLKEQNSTIVETFSKQLDATLHATLLKYLNKMLKECGEALLVDVSEVLFNELAFFRLMQTMGGQKNPDFRSVTSHSQTTTENEEEGQEGERGRGAGREEGQEGGRSGGTGREEGEKEGTEVLPLLQALNTAVAKTLSDEQEALGKSRDDDFAKEWDSQLQERQSSPSIDEEQTVMVELSTSESKPIQSVGSGDEDIEGGTMQATTSSTQSKGALPPQPFGEREETPPTPVIAAVSAVPGQSMENSGASGDVKGQTVQSPPPDLSTAALEVQMKAEQQSTEGIAGILTTIEQQQELAGEIDQLPRPPGPSEVIAEP